MIYRLMTVIVSAIGFFLSAWVILPAPIFELLPLAIGAPEVSPWLWLVNLLGGGLAIQLLRISRKSLQERAGENSRKNFRFAYFTLGLSSLGLALSLLPIAQFPATNQAAQVAMEKFCNPNLKQVCDSILKPGNLTASPSAPPSPQTIQTIQTMLRPQPFMLQDAWRGIPSLPVRYDRGISQIDPTTNPTEQPLDLDVYRPPQAGKYPAIVIIHGGAWQGGSPRDNAEFSRYMAARGYVVWAITYRYAPKYKFPAQIEDVQKALSYIQKHALEYDTDLNRVVLMGRSAGAHLAMLAAYDTPKPNTPIIRAVVNYYGPVDLTAGYYDPPNPDPINSRSILRDFLGGTPDQVGELYKAASPITYVDRYLDKYGDKSVQKPVNNSVNKPTQNGLSQTLPQGSLPPSLLIYGGKDHIVMAKFGKALAEKLVASGNQAMFLEIPWADHSFDAVFSGISNQLALYYTERFLAIVLSK